MITAVHTCTKFLFYLFNEIIIVTYYAAVIAD